MSSDYREWAPSPELAEHVRCLWGSRVAGARHSQRVIPDGCVDLLWADGGLRVVGPDTRWRDVDASPGSRMVAVRLRPGAARLLLGDIAPHELQDTTTDLAQLWGSSADRLLDEASTGPVGPALERALCERLPRFGEVDPLVHALVAEFDAGAASLAELDLGITDRQLRRRVVAAVGYGPKALHRVLRLQRTLRMETRGGLAELAVAAGFADQAHLSREVRSLTGRTPSAYLPLENRNASVA
ncbi:helix-turn-helix transcriptional regulator [Allokutzneria multivorans]|uniref:Helix-turn-helix transcriptional regulator n=1 Tax=Allokutzneria multivorans TaxID=1142134 RepID=A0ABP7TNN2_9PSEU